VTSNILDAQPLPIDCIHANVSDRNRFNRSAQFRNIM